MNTLSYLNKLSVTEADAVLMHWFVADAATEDLKERIVAVVVLEERKHLKIKYIFFD
jgi:hypothetical protein